VRIHVSSRFAQVNNPQSTTQVELCLLRGSYAMENESGRIQASSCNSHDRWNYSVYLPMTADRLVQKRRHVIHNACPD
jgi:hypothetical protein